MSDMFHEQPTEKAPHIEPTQQASNPYELADPYMNYGTLPDIPPPPRIRQKHNFIWLVGIGVFVALISLSFIVYALYGHANSNTEKTSLSTTTKPAAVPTTGPTIIIETPTPQPPTSTPTQVVAYYANDIYNDFVVSGYGGPDPKNDTNWSCCTYVPAGGAIYWTDSRSGYVLDIATFYTLQDAQTDAHDLFQKGYYANVVHACLLSYDKDVPASVINPYLQLMQQYCN